ncbi:hypothetical protein [Marinobacter alexandrii]|uniref:hypothetical protein n=1 Tax=Marinobacter alexandrii TaxID=2570351 RepID=UPI00110825D0|nr:hypothetical protein [Marinobacter alexandrii]
MEFLCPTHRQQFANLSLEERKDLWLFWMENAHACIERGDWRDVISLSGSAMDLACLDGATDESCMHVELTLAAILVSQALSICGDITGKEQVLSRALKVLRTDDSLAISPECCGMDECVLVLSDRTRHAEFFSDHLNWSAPHFPFRQPVVSRVRVLH